MILCKHQRDGVCHCDRVPYAKPSRGYCLLQCEYFKGDADWRNRKAAEMDNAAALQQRTTKWLGIRWIGTPWPKRWRIWGGWLVYWPDRGCGCMAKPKHLMVTLFGRRFTL